MIYFKDNYDVYTKRKKITVAHGYMGMSVPALFDHAKQKQAPGRAMIMIVILLRQT